MLSTEEIKKLTDYQVEVFKDVFATKDDLKEVKSTLHSLQISLDSIAKDTKDIKAKQGIGNRRIKDLEDFADEAAPKLGMKFEH